MDELIRYGLHAWARIWTVSVVLILVVGIELIVPTRKRYPVMARLRGGSFVLIGAFTMAVAIDPLQQLWAALGLSPLLELHFDRWFAWAGPLAAILAGLLALVVADFFGYWFHRIQHGPLWRFHAVHHSIEELHATNSYTHLADTLFQFVLITIPMSFIPISQGAQPAVMTLLIALHPYFIHSPMLPHLGPLRRVVTDNRYHRIHHSTDPAHFGRNFGTTTTIWDQVFGTAYFPKPDEWPDTGLADMREPRNLWDWLVAPFRFRRRPQASETFLSR